MLFQCFNIQMFLIFRLFFSFSKKLNYITNSCNEILPPLLVKRSRLDTLSSLLRPAGWMQQGIDLWRSRWKMFSQHEAILLPCWCYVDLFTPTYWAASAVSGQWSPWWLGDPKGKRLLINTKLKISFSLLRLVEIYKPVARHKACLFGVITDTLVGSVLLRFSAAFIEDWIISSTVMKVTG